MKQLEGHNLILCGCIYSWNSVLGQDVSRGANNFPITVFHTLKLFNNNQIFMRECDMKKFPFSPFLHFSPLFPWLNIQPFPSFFLPFFTCILVLSLFLFLFPPFCPYFLPYFVCSSFPHLTVFLSPILFHPSCHLLFISTSFFTFFPPPFHSVSFLPCFLTRILVLFFCRSLFPFSPIFPHFIPHFSFPHLISCFFPCFCCFFLSIFHHFFPHFIPCFLPSFPVSLIASLLFCSFLLSLFNYFSCLLLFLVYFLHCFLSFFPHFIHGFFPSFFHSFPIIFLISFLPFPIFPCFLPSFILCFFLSFFPFLLFIQFYSKYKHLMRNKWNGTRPVPLVTHYSEWTVELSKHWWEKGSSHCCP